MAQHNDYDIENASGANFRANLNLVLGAIVTKNSGNAEPETAFPYMWWVDTSGAYPILKIRNDANSAWIVTGRLDQPNFGLNYTQASNEPPVAPQPFQSWVDTNGAYPILKTRNQANDAWITIGRLDMANYGLMPIAGGVFTGAVTFGSTDYVLLPRGSTAQRPVVPGSGMMRFNNTNNVFEGYKNGAWGELGGGGYLPVANQAIAANGTVVSTTTDQRQLRPISGNGAPVNLSITPFGNAGGWKDGTEILLIGTEDDNSVTLTFNDANYGAVGEFNEIEITKYKQVLLVWVASLTRWVVR